MLIIEYIISGSKHGSHNVRLNCSHKSQIAAFPLTDLYFMHLIFPLVISQRKRTAEYAFLGLEAPEHVTKRSSILMTRTCTLVS